MSEYFIQEGQKREEFCGRNKYIPDSVKLDGNIFKSGTVAFVGKYTLENEDTIYSCPKYYDSSIIAAIQKERPVSKGDEQEVQDIDYPSEKEKIKKHIRQILDILRKMQKQDANLEESAIFSPDEKQEESKVIDKISLAEFILDDYMNYGLYYDDHKVTGRQSRGKISWNRTIKKTEPFLDDDEVVYMNLIRKYNFKDYNNLMTRIHASVIHYSYEFMGNFGEYMNVVQPDVELLSDDDLRKPEIANYIANRMRTVFSNREIHLFRALEAWCGNSRYYSRFIYGSTSFHVVWERVNDEVWGDKNINKNSGNPKYHYGEWKNKGTDGLGNPQYEFKEEDFYNGKGESIIDTLRIVNFDTDADSLKDQYCIVVFDSKYYVIKDMNKQEIFGYPSNVDISKQVGYINIIKQSEIIKQTGEAEILYSNAFLLPLDEVIKKEVIQEKLHNDNGEVSMYKVLGYVTRGSFGDQEDLDPVLLIYCDPEQLYDYYLRDKKVEDDEIKDIAYKYKACVN